MSEILNTDVNDDQSSEGKNLPLKEKTVPSLALRTKNFGVLCFKGRLTALANKETLSQKHCFQHCFLSAQTRKHLLRKKNEQLQKHFCFPNICQYFNKKHNPLR